MFPTPLLEAIIKYRLCSDSHYTMTTYDPYLMAATIYPLFLHYGAILSPTCFNEHQVIWVDALPWSFVHYVHQCPRSLV